MAWWEWLIVGGLFVWLKVDLYQLRQEVDEGLRTVDQRRIDAMRAAVRD